MAGKPYTSEQLIDLGYIVIAFQTIFWLDLHYWICRPSDNQSWPDFITFFREAHQELRETEKSMNEMGYQLTNLIVY